MKYTLVLSQHEPSFKDFLPWRELNSMHIMSRLPFWKRYRLRQFKIKLTFDIALVRTKPIFNHGMCGIVMKEVNGF